MTTAILCDSCINAATDEAGYDLDAASTQIILIEMGADIADHICDSRENGQACHCACNNPNRGLGMTLTAATPLKEQPDHLRHQKDIQETQRGPQDARKAAPEHKPDRWTISSPITASSAQGPVPDQEKLAYHVLAVGQPNGGQARPRRESTIYNLRSSQHALDIYLNAPTQEELSAFRDNDVQLGFWLNTPVLWIIFQIPGIGCFDAPYTPHLVDPKERTLPDTSNPQTRATLLMTLNDARDSIVRGIRFITMSPDLTRALQTAVLELSQTSHNQRAYDAQIKRTYRQYPDAASMIKKATMKEQLGA